MKEFSIRELQRIELSMLKDITSFCDQNNIVYFLIYGTLLGSIRHEGFIPWDDDIDIAMDKRNFKKFNRLARKNMPSKYFIQCNKTDKNYFQVWTKVCLNNTTAIDYDATNYKMHWGISIDIFMFSGLSKNVLGQRCQKKAIKWLIPLERKHYYKSINKPLTNTEKRIISFIPESLRKPAIAFLKLFAYRNLSNTDFCFSNYSKKIDKCFKSHFFKKENLTKVKFEDTYFWAPKKYDEVLSVLYGNWHELPPVNERKAHFKKIYDLQNDYLHYLCDSK